MNPQVVDGAPERIRTARLILNPHSIAIVGATEDRGKFGGRILAMLIEKGFKGKLYPINPKRKELFGLPAFPDVKNLPASPDVVIIVLPPPHTQSVMETCAELGIPAAIVIASGYAEAGVEGKQYQEKLSNLARMQGPRLLGPNCLGIVNTHDSVFSCASHAFDNIVMVPGNVSFVSQSGALMTTIVNRAQDEGLGFRYLVSVGNEADLDVCDFLEIFLDDSKTRVATLFLEHIRRPKRFRELARHAREIGKPIVALKIGRSALGVISAKSHTAAVAGDDTIIDAVFRTDGIVRVNTIESLISTVKVFSLCPRPLGPNVFILSASGGACGLLGDLAAEYRLPLSTLGETGRAALDPLYSMNISNNPLDLGGMRQGVALFQPEIVQQCLEGIGSDPNVHALIFGLTAQPFMKANMHRLVDFAKNWGKPVIVYGSIGSAGTDALNVVTQAGIPVIRDAEHCVRAVTALTRSSVPLISKQPIGRDNLVMSVPSGKGPLTEIESKKILLQWGLPLPREQLATSPDQAVDIAAEFGGSVALKIVSADIPHKTEVGGVRTNLSQREDIHHAFQEIKLNVHAACPNANVEGILVQEMVKGIEVIVGSKRDPQFGTIVLVGLGGILVELLKDVSLKPAPVNPEESLQMLRDLRGFPLLDGFRGSPKADVEALVDLVTSFSSLAAALGQQVSEIDLNPVIVQPRGMGARIVDALVVREGA